MATCTPSGLSLCPWRDRHHNVGALTVWLIGQTLAQMRGTSPKFGIKQVDRLLSDAGVVLWDLFSAWVRKIVLAMDWTDFVPRQAWDEG